MSSGRHFILRHSLSDYRSYRCGVGSADIHPLARRLAFQPKFPYFADFLIFATLPLPRSKPPAPHRMPETRQAIARGPIWSEIAEWSGWGDFNPPPAPKAEVGRNTHSV